jgi:hypothetical protein
MSAVKPLEPGEAIPEPAPSVARPDIRVPKPADTVLELVWFSPALLGRLRRNGVWASILTPIGKAARNTMTMVSAAPPETDEAAEAALESDTVTILARARPGEGDLEDVLFEARKGGALAPELTLLAGDLDLPFDEVAWLTTLITAAAPLAAGDSRLAAVLDHAAAMVKTPLQAAPEVTSSLAASVREAWSQANRVLPPEHLDNQVTRALLSQRSYQRRDLLGDTWVRALFTVTGTPAAVPAYLPETAARKLPLFARIPVRVLVDVVPQQDQHEESAVALKLGAIARVVTRTRRAEE